MALISIPGLRYQKQIAAGVLAVAALATALFWLRAERPSPQPAKPKVVTYSTDQPSETPPKADDWQGGQLDPKRILIPTLSVDGLIQRVGVDQNKQIAVPTNIHMAGWFVDTVRPGQKGLSIIDGHVDGRRANGIFLRLELLEKDDEIRVEMGDGSVKRYAVIKVVSVPAKEAPNFLFSQEPGVSSQLNLVTCGGQFDKQKQAYADRVIISAKLL